MDWEAGPEATCLLCERTLSRRGMGRHLKACRSKRRPKGAASKALAKGSFGLFVEGSPVHWLHLEVDADLTLADLDAFLRRTWLECCGHMSDFRIGPLRYGGSAGEWDPWEGVLSMEVPLWQVLGPGTKFAHSYDFGSTTELTLRVTAEGEASVKKGAIEIQARNTPPIFSCSQCGEPAVHVCSECVWSEKGWLCGACAKRHACGEEMLLPVVDSPRVGVCGYTG